MALRVARQHQFRCSTCGQPMEAKGAQALSKATCPTCRRAQTVPARLQDLLLQEKVASTTAGETFRGTDELLGRKVDVLVLKKADGKYASLVEATARVYRALAQLDHPYLQRVHRMLNADGHMIFVTEPRTQSLGTLTHGTKVPPAHLLNLAIQSVHGLEAASAAGMCHMGLCPACFHVRANLSVHVADFSPWNYPMLARPAAGWASLAPEPFLAPETRIGKRPDMRSDMYALGVCLLSFLTRQTPSSQAAASDILDHTRDAMPRNWSRTLSALLAVKPADRPENWSRVLALLKGRGVDAHLKATPESLEDLRERSTMAHRSLHANDGKGPSDFLDGMMNANVEVGTDEVLGQIWSIAGPEDAVHLTGEEMSDAKAESPVDILTRAVMDDDADMSNTAMLRAMRVGEIG